MKMLFALLILVTVCASAENVPMRQTTNEYFTITMPSDWSLDMAGGKEGEMQMSLRFAVGGTTNVLPVFAYWDGLDPRKWVGTNVVSHYTVGSCEYFVKKADRQKELWMITQGKTFIVNAVLPLELDGETLSVLLNCLHTVKPN